MAKLTKKDRMYFVKESIKEWMMDGDKREDLAKDFEYYLDIHLSQSSWSYLDDFKIQYENLGYKKHNYGYAFEISQRKINTIIKNILLYNNY